MRRTVPTPFFEPPTPLTLPGALLPPGVDPGAGAAYGLCPLESVTVYGARSVAVESGREAREDGVRERTDIGREIEGSASSELVETKVIPLDSVGAGVWGEGRGRRRERLRVLRAAAASVILREWTTPSAFSADATVLISHGAGRSRSMPALWGGASSSSASMTLSPSKTDESLGVVGPSEESERLRLRRRLGAFEDVASVRVKLLPRGGVTGAGYASETRFPPTPRMDFRRASRAEIGRTIFDAARLRREKRGMVSYGIAVNQFSSLSSPLREEVTPGIVEVRRLDEGPVSARGKFGGIEKVETSGVDMDAVIELGERACERRRGEGGGGEGGVWMMLEPALLGLVGEVAYGGGTSGRGGGACFCPSGRLTSSMNEARLESRLEAEDVGTGGMGGGGSKRTREGRFGVDDLRMRRITTASSSGLPSLNSAGPARGDERSGFRVRIRLWRSNACTEDRLLSGRGVREWRRGGDLDENSPEASIMQGGCEKEGTGCKWISAFVGPRELKQETSNERRLLHFEKTYRYLAAARKARHVKAKQRAKQRAV
ncbi:hypothetical protein C8F04DRAFT_1196445 [Mycena alexandri]|uniref:Uncharacterized protein n=1 Tax=Mycena alexandri TaxID=1745969 RepID=A0AAD6S3M6_9AGAR|nr:hypothetical protein C8F04DRAFT_1196445 [Mycena alexandri]